MDDGFGAKGGFERVGIGGRGGWLRLGVVRRKKEKQKKRGGSRATGEHSGWRCKEISYSFSPFYTRHGNKGQQIKCGRLHKCLSFFPLLEKREAESMLLWVTVLHSF